MVSGFLLVLEGIDGAGKSTLARRLVAWCNANGLDCVFSREPTDGPYGTELRRSAQTGRLSPEAELDLFIRDRKEHVAHLIQRAQNARHRDRELYFRPPVSGKRGA